MGYNLGGHSETVQIEYDPSVISYEDLLNVFWESHYPEYPTMSTQYKSIIFYHNEEQRELAEQSKQAEEERLGQKIYTEIVHYTTFYLAEDYHQKYYLRMKSDIERYYEAIYPDLNDFIGSTAVTRLNGYLGGNGSLEMLEKEADTLGLTDTMKEEVFNVVSVYDRSGAVCDN